MYLSLMDKNQLHIYRTSFYLLISQKHPVMKLYESPMYNIQIKTIATHSAHKGMPLTLKQLIDNKVTTSFCFFFFFDV